MTMMRSGRARSSRGPENKILEEMHHVPTWVKWSARSSRWCWASCTAWYMYISRRRLPRNLAEQHCAALPVPAQQVVFRRALRLPVRALRPSALGRFLWKRVTVGVIDGLGPNGIAARVVDVTRPRRPAADRLPLSLCVRDADRHRGARYLDDAREFLLMTDWPILSNGHLPAARRRGAPAADERETVRTAAATCSERLAADHGRHLRPLAVHLDRFRQCQSGLPDDREARLAGHRHLLSSRRRRHLDAVRHPDDLPDAVLRAGQLARRSRSA